MTDQFLNEGLSSILSVGRATIANACGGGREPPQRPNHYEKFGSFHTAAVPCRRRKVQYDDENYLQSIKHHQELAEVAADGTTATCTTNQQIPSSAEDSTKGSGESSKVPAALS